MPTIKRTRVAVLLAIALSAFFAPAVAETLLRAVPTPDLSKLPAEQAKQIAETRAEFDKVQATLIGPPLAEAYAQIGALYARAGFNDAAAIAFYDAAQIAPTDGRWLYLRGVLARTSGLNADARADFEAALARDKLYLPIRYRLVDTLVDLGDLAAARKVLEATLHDYADLAVAHAMLGQLALREKRYAEAIEQLNAALKLEPQANALYRSLSEAYALQGNAQAAQEAQGKAGNVGPVIVDPLALGMSAAAAPATSKTPGAAAVVAAGNPLQEAQQLLAQGRIAAARAKVGLAIQANENDVAALALSARIEAALGEMPIAAALADSALKLKPDDAAANLARGEVYEFGGDEAHALEYYQRALHGDAKLADAHLLLGNADMRHARYASAVDHYRQFVAAHDDDAAANAPLVAAQVAAGRCGDALGEVNSALAKRAKDGDLMQIFVRLASTCRAAKPEERDMALDYANVLYKQRADADNSAALALAMAAHGKFGDAQQYQAAAIFDALRDGDRASAALYKTTQASFVAKQMPDRPWPAEHALFKPPLLTPIQAPAAAAAAKPASKQ